MFLNLGYLFEGSFQRLGDYQFVSQTFGGPQTIEKGVGNRFAGTWVATLPVPLPKNYLLGIDIQAQRFRKPRRKHEVVFSRAVVRPRVLVVLRVCPGY